jgi:hypothetical protein
MASHFISIDKNANPLFSSSFTTGTSTSAAKVFEFRVLDGASVKRIEALQALEAFEWYIKNQGLVAASGFDITT